MKPTIYKQQILTSFEKGKGPREKLISKGAESLSDQELLAVIIGSGSKGLNVLKLAQDLLETAPIQEINFDSIQKIKGVGESTACKIAAVIEFGHRMYKKRMLVIDTPMKAVGFLSFITTKKEENLVLITLNGGNQLIKTRIIFIGTLNRSLIHPREIFAKALKDRAAGIIIAHNHPSGNCTPSGEDINVTRMIKESANILGIQLIDHIIVSPDDYFSFMENKVL